VVAVIVERLPLQSFSYYGSPCLLYFWLATVSPMSENIIWC
jgi:hypothetical protein